MTLKMSDKAQDVVSNTNGLVPIGSIIPCAPGYFNAVANGGGWVVAGPATNTIADMNVYIGDAYRVADGTAPNTGESPIFNTAARFMPDLTDGRFLMGNTTAGSVGGQTNVTLIEANLPAHAHAMGSHNHSLSGLASNVTLTGTTSFASTAHTHDMRHVHAWATKSGSTVGGTEQLVTNVAANTNTTLGGDTIVINNDAGGTRGLFGAASTGGADDSFTNTDGKWYTSGVISSPSGSGNSAKTGGPTTPHASVGISNGAMSGTVANEALGNTGDTGSGTSFDNRPQFLSIFYIIRIK